MCGEAIVAFEKAENDSPNGKCPHASYCKGNSLCDLDRYEQAILAFEKAENDSPNGKYPDASFNKGRYLFKLKRYEEAIIANVKAVNDNPNGKSPDAFNNLGLCLYKLERYEEAIIAYEKAENDGSNSIFPEASYNKGYSLWELKRYEEAIAAFEKTLNDSPKHYYPEAHLSLSKIYQRRNYELSKKHAFMAINQDSRDYSNVKWIFNNFTSKDSMIQYENRCNYLNLLLQNAALGGYAFDNFNELSTLLKNNFDIEPEKDQYFCFLLTIQNIELPVNLSYVDRLRLAYLIHIKNNRPWEAFYIIDEILDSKYKLNAMDNYYYLLSACQIGESKKELRWFNQNSIIYDLDIDNPFYDLYTVLSNLILTKIEENAFYDPYLIKLTREDLPNISDFINLSSFKPDIGNILNIIDSDESLDISFSTNELKGFLSQHILTSDQWRGVDLEVNSNEWKNLISSLREIALNPEQIIFNVRKIVGNGESQTYKKVIMLFAVHYLKSESNEERRLYSILQAATYLSYYFDYKKEDRITKEMLINCTDLSISELPRLIAVEVIGLGWALSFLTNIYRSYKTKLKKVDANQQFELLITEIKNW